MTISENFRSLGWVNVVMMRERSDPTVCMMHSIACFKSERYSGAGCRICTLAVNSVF